MSAPDMRLYSSPNYAYVTTASAYNIVSTLGAPSRQVIVTVAGTINFTKLDGTSTTGAGTVNAGDVLTVQATSLTLGGGAEAWVLT